MLGEDDRSVSTPSTNQKFLDALAGQRAGIAALSRPMPAARAYLHTNQTRSSSTRHPKRPPKRSGRTTGPLRPEVTSRVNGPTKNALVHLLEASPETNG
jgi:hypothetical protein